jgi:hypothetical protein
MLENRAMKKMSRVKREEAKELYNKYTYDLCFLLNTIWVIMQGE